MYLKGLGIIITIVFVIVSWYVYALYPFVQNLIFALLASTIALVNIIIVYTKANKNQVAQSTETFRGIFSVVAMLLFFVFFALSVKYGGSAASHEEALNQYDNYEVGKYYLVSHGNFTMVSYNVWYRMKILEIIVLPTFLIMFIWNFINIVKTKGWKYALSGREKDSI